MPVNNRNRRAFVAPKFQLGDLPPRCLQPMAAVGRDTLGTTSYAVQYSCGSDGSATNYSESVQQLGSMIGCCATIEPSPQSGVACHSATCVLPHLYLGGQGDASSSTLLRKLRIRRILNVAGECMPSSDSDNEAELHIQSKHLEIRDHSDEKIESHFDDALQYIHEAICSGEAVLVHCRFGVSRSATIVMAYLMKYGTKESKIPSRMSYESVFDFVKSKRPQVSPNLGFVLALHQLDAEHGTNKSSSNNNNSMDDDNNHGDSGMVC